MSHDGSAVGINTPQKARESNSSGRVTCVPERSAGEETHLFKMTDKLRLFIMGFAAQAIFRARIDL